MDLFTYFPLSLRILSFFAFEDLISNEILLSRSPYAIRSFETWVSRFGDFDKYVSAREDFSADNWSSNDLNFYDTDEALGMHPSSVSIL